MTMLLSIYYMEHNSLYPQKPFQKNHFIKLHHMKHIHYRTILQHAFIVCAISCLFTSCTKDPDEFFGNKHPKKHTYIDNFKTTFSTTNYVFGNGNEAPPTSAEFPGGGDGYCNLIRTAHVKFNQRIIFATFQQQPLPVVLAFPELSVFGLPTNSVNSIVFDDKGNSIWFEGGGSGIPVSPIRVEFSIVSKIVGGSGKFKGAYGNSTLKGYFNPQNNQDAEISSNGIIYY
jgi:hypothetical protein